MTMGPAEMERKVRQLDNDVQSIYDLLGSIQATQQRHWNRFTDIDHRLEAHDRRFDAVDEILGILDHRSAGEPRSLSSRVLTRTGRIHRSGSAR